LSFAELNTEVADQFQSLSSKTTLGVSISYVQLYSQLPKQKNVLKTEMSHSAQDIPLRLSLREYLDEKKQHSIAKNKVYFNIFIVKTVCESSLCYT
jgi:hypothetical protein